MALPNFYKKKLALRNLKEANINSLKFLDTGVIYCSSQKDYSVGTIASYYAILKLISSRTPAVVRAQKSSALLKIRKGAPVGAKLNLRKNYLESFYSLLLHQILPQLSSFKPLSNVSKNKEMAVTIKITDIFLFAELRPFYFYFNKFSDLRVLLNFNKKLFKNAPEFLLSLFEFPIKQTKL